MSLRTPLKNARSLGSVRSGTDHFWKSRVTAVANLVLSVFFAWLVITLADADHARVKEAFASPLVAVPMLLLVLSATVHMRLGMQTIIEDYVHGEAAKVLLLMLNTFFALAIGAASTFAVLKLGFGG